MAVLERIYELIFRALEILIVAITASMLTAICVSVFYRYVLNNSLAWADEFPSLMLIWLTFAGAALLAKKNEHLNFDGLTSVLPVAAQKVCFVVSTILIIIFLGYLGWYGWVIAEMTMARRAVTMPVSMGLVRLIVPISAGLMILAYLAALFRVLSGGRPDAVSQQDVQ